MGDVEALDAQQRDWQFQRFLQFLQRLGPDGQVTCPAGLVEPERVLGVIPDRGHERGLVTALRNADVHLGAADSAEPRRKILCVARLNGHQDFARKPALDLGVLAVDLLEEVFDEVGGGEVLHLLDNPAALAADPAAPDMEHLDGRFEFVLVQGENVGVGVLGEHHGVPFEDLLEGGDVIPQAGGAFVVKDGDGGPHLLFEPRDEPLGLASHEGAEVLGQGAVFLGRDTADAGGRAFVDVAQQAGPAAGLRPLQDSRAAAAHGKDPEQSVHGFPDGTGRVRAEVTGALAPLAAHDLHARQLLAHGDGKVGVGLVVPEHHVEPRLEFLDPGVFQLQGFQLAAHHGPLDAAGRVHHGMGLGKQPGRVREVRVQPRPEVLGLADVDDPPVGIPEPVNTRIGRNLTRLGPITRWICHVSSLLSRGGADCRRQVASAYSMTLLWL